MARIRTIKPEFPQSESMGRVSRDARLTFIELWTLADDEGRLRGNSRMLASLLFPYDDDAKDLIDGWLRELESEDCLTRYKIGGDSYIQISNWLIHQKIDKPSKSKIPAFDESSRILANPREVSSEDQGSRTEGPKDDSGELDLQAQAADAPPPVVAIPLNDGSEYGIYPSQVEEWSSAYPNVDVVAELKKMRQWSIANPKKRKTRRGVMAFANSWLSNTQDKGGGKQTQSSAFGGGEKYL